MRLVTFDCWSSWIRLWMLTVSNALLRSSETTIVRSAGCYWLNPVVIWLVRWCSAVEVECWVLKPCWWLTGVMFDVMWGRSTFSIVLAIGDSSDIGLYEVPRFGSLLGFGIGMIFASFQICAIQFVFSARFRVSVKYWIAIGPRCFRCLMFRLSGPVESLFIVFLMAS